MTWGVALVARLRAARLNPPTMNDVVDQVEAAGRRGVARSRTRSGRLQVQTRGDRITVQTTGGVRPAVVAEVNRARPQIEAQLRKAASDKIRSR